MKYTPFFKLDIDESVEYDYVVRDGKKVRKAISTKPGYKIDNSGSSPKEVKMASSEIRDRRKGAVKAARKPVKSSEINKRKKSTNKRTWESIKEDINIPLNPGDTFLHGKFKNKSSVYKDSYINDKGDLVIITDTGKEILASKFRLKKSEE